MVAERLDHLRVDEIEDLRPRVNDRHLHIEGAEHGGVLEADHTGAHHDGGVRNVLALQELIRVEDVGAVALDLGMAGGACAAGDQEVVRGGDDLVVVPLNLDRVRIDEARRPLEKGHVVALKLGAHHVEFVFEHAHHPEVEVLEGDALLHAVVFAVEGALAEAREV
jgi:hypothetical protein